LRQGQDDTPLNDFVGRSQVLIVAEGSVVHATKSIDWAYQSIAQIRDTQELLGDARFGP
jgi:hypothetical protein